MRAKLMVGLGLAVLALAIITGVKQHQLNQLREDKQRLTNNQSALLAQVQSFKIKVGRDSLNGANVRALKLELDEVKQHRSQDIALLKELGIKLRYAQSLLKNATITENRFTVPVRDTVVKSSGHIDTLRCVTYKDKWFEFDGCIDRENRFTGHTASVDTLVGVPNIIPKKFLFFRWGIKAIQFTAINKNPNSKIYFQEYYEIK